MFDQMRRNTKAILWITIIAFVGLIFLAWGADFQFGGAGQAPAGTIGMVNGEPLPSQVYEQNVAMARSNYQQQSGREVDDRTEALIRNQSWNDMIRETLMRQEAQRRGIRVTDDEIVNAIMNQPPQEVVQNPGFQTDGRFDLAKYQAILRDPNFDTRALEAQYRTSLPMQKLQMEVLGAVSVSDAELWNTWEAQNERVQVSYVLLPAGKFDFDPGSVDPSALQQYYEGHKKTYKAPPQAVVQFVSLSRNHTEQDSLNLIDMARQVIQEHRDGEEFSVLIDAYSEAAPSMQGGPNAAWMSADQIADPSVRAAAFSLEPGQVSDVLIGSSGVHVIRVEEKQTIETGEQVKIADIFMPLKASVETLSQVRDTILQFRQEAGERSFDAAAGDMKLQIKETPPFGEEGFIPGLGSAPEIQDFAFRSEVGAISQPFERSDGWIVARLKERREARIPDLGEVQERVRQEAADSLRMVQAMPIAENMLRMARGGAPLQSVAAGDPRAVYDVTEPFPRLGYPKGIGNDPALIGPLFATQQGVVPQVLRGRSGLVIASVDSRLAADRDQFETQKDQLRQTLIQRRQQKLLNEWYASLRKSADIVDYRFGDFAG